MNRNSTPTTYFFSVNLYTITYFISKQTTEVGDSLYSTSLRP